MSAHRSPAQPAAMATGAGDVAGGSLRGRLLMLGAAVLWSTSGAILKSPPAQSIPEADRGLLMACYRTLFATAVLLPFVRPRNVRWRPMLVPLVISFALMNLLFVVSMTYTTSAAAIFLQYTSTVWSFVFGVMFLHERIDRGNLVALMFAVCGIGWIVQADWGGENYFGNLIALGSGISYAGVILCLRELRDEDSAWLIALAHAGSGLVLLPLVLAGNAALSPSGWLIAAVLGAAMAVPYVLFAKGVRFVTVQEAALLCLLEPVLNPLWVWLLWRESVAPATWVGGGLIIGGLAIRYLLFPARPVVQPRAVPPEVVSQPAEQTTGSGG